MGYLSNFCRVLFARAPVLGVCFFVSVNRQALFVNGNDSDSF